MVLFCILIYLAMGTSTAFITLVVAFKNKWDNMDRQAAASLSFIFWPLVLPILLIGHVISLMSVKAKEIAER